MFSRNDLTIGSRVLGDPLGATWRDLSLLPKVLWRDALLCSRFIFFVIVAIEPIEAASAHSGIAVRHGVEIIDFQVSPEATELLSGPDVGQGSKSDQPAPYALEEPKHSIVRVPRWMRQGLVTPRAIVGSLPTSQNAVCVSYTYTYLPSSLLGRSAEERRRTLLPLVHRAACEAGLPIGLMDAMIIQESGYNPLAVSQAGAFGLGQLMPGTARQLGVNRYDLRQNLSGAARYLRQHLAEFGDVALALAAYNAGPGRVRARRGVPDIAETRDYVRSILRNWVVLESNRRTTA